MASPLVTSALGRQNEAPRRTRAKTSGTQGTYAAVYEIFGPPDLFLSDFFLEDKCLYAFTKLFAINGV